MVSKPHGGKLVKRLMSEKARERTLEEKDSYIRINVSERVALDLENIAYGSGVLATFALMHFTLLSPREVIGTSLVYGLLISILGALMHTELGNVNYNLALYLIIGTIPGFILEYL